MKISDLSFAALNVQTRHVDWSTGWGETWESFEATDCRCKDDNPRCKCPGIIYSTDPQCRCGYEMRESFDGPMMNYAYSLPCFDLIPVCLVQFTGEDVDGDEEWSLALTGGGMDLSWEICLAYVKLGYVPPRDFWRFPKMASMKLTPEKNRVLRAAERGLRYEISSLRSDKQRIADIRAWMKANSERRAS
jgi:hypothetical protein